MEFADDRMRAEKVVISNPKGNGVISRIQEFIAAGVAVGSFEGAVETFDHLLERTKLCCNGIILVSPIACVISNLSGLSSRRANC